MAGGKGGVLLEGVGGYISYDVKQDLNKTKHYLITIAVVDMSLVCGMLSPIGDAKKSF